ncbi:MAG: tetratricopeptide repeat protein [Spirochaetales bacterium]|nr:tetratricopeptide repeat protein [Spirochaetales bacterium]
MRKPSAIFFFIILVFPAFAQETAQAADNPIFVEASRLYRTKQYDAAIAKYEEALKADSSDVRIYLNMSVIYRILGNYPKAIETLQNGLKNANRNRYKLFLNIGDCYYAKKELHQAEKNYSAAVDDNGLYPDSYLQRANTRMDLQLTKEAAGDYRTYLRLKPNAPQRPKIEQLLALLDKEAADQAALLDNILNSLKNASSGTHTDSAGVDDFKDTGSSGGDILD